MRRCGFVDNLLGKYNAREYETLLSQEKLRKNIMAEQCTHLSEIKNPAPRTPGGCEECLKTGDSWVHLRLCEMCGHVGCCDSSKNKHATKHFHVTQHAIVKSLEPGEDWGYCYADDLFYETLPNVSQ